MNEWGHFVEDVRSFYDVDLSCISSDFEKVTFRTELHAGSKWQRRTVFVWQQCAAVMIKTRVLHGATPLP